MPLTIADLTTNIATTTDGEYVVTGDGVFDDVMETVNKHLDAQYKLGRITGTDYATVYLGAMQSALQQAVAFVLGKDKTNSEILLIDAQELKVDAETALTTQKATLDLASNNAEVALLDQKEITEWAQTEQTTNLTPTATSAMGLQGALLTAQELKTDADTSKTTAEETALTNASAAEVALVDQKEITEWAQTEQTTATAPTATSVIGVDAALKAAQTAKLGAEETATANKAAAEVSLLDQKEITEWAQTQQTTNVAPDAASILGAQGTLLIEQGKGFQWNADQKYLKTLLDAWSINISTAGVAATGVDAINEVGVGNINDQIANAEPT